ncbi:MAG TPA: alkaline phosphatase family protein [Thermoguttaceae bacterium]|nr:alkaline phosphatase family protein [Thermoguttaceae bacterium]
MRNAMLCLMVASMLAVPAWAQDASREGAPQNVILFGWDGAQREHVHQCLERGELPTLKKLSEEGALVAVDVVTGATDTKAGWSQILTGYNPEVTGVYSNGRFRDIPEGLSIFERLKKHFGPEDFVCVAAIGKSGHCGEIREPFKKRLDEVERGAEAKQTARKKKESKQPGAGKQKTGNVVEEDGVKYLVFEGSPYYTMHKSCDVWDYGLKEDEKVGTRALELLEKYKNKPFFFFVHFAEVDHSGHQHGENSKEYNDALISNDTWTGKIVEKLKELGLYDKTLVYVTADHGFNEDGTGHSYAPFVFLGTNDPKVKRDGMRQDVAPTILARFGLDPSKNEPALDGEPLTEPATKPVLKAPEEKPGQKAPARKRKQRAAAKKAA